MAETEEEILAERGLFRSMRAVLGDDRLAADLDCQGSLDKCEEEFALRHSAAVTTSRIQEALESITRVQPFPLERCAELRTALKGQRAFVFRNPRLENDEALKSRLSGFGARIEADCPAGQ